MVGCSIYGCKSRSESKVDGLTFHQFPQDPVRRRAWTLATGRINWQPNRNSRMCVKHFSREMLIFINKSTRLQHTAVPTLNLPKTRYHSRRQKRYLKMPPGAISSPGSIGSKFQKEFNSYENVTRRSNLPIIAKVYLYLEKEYEYMKALNGDNCDLSPLADILKRTAEATDVNEEKVVDILKTSNLEHHLPERVKRKRRKSPEKHSEVIRCTSDANNTTFKTEQSFVKLKSDVSRCQEGTLYLEVSPIPLRFISNNKSVISDVKTTKVKSEPNSDEETMSVQSDTVEEFLDSELNDEDIPDSDKNSRKSYEGVEYLDEDFDYVDEDTKMDVEQYSYSGDKPSDMNTSWDSLDTEIKIELEDND